MFGEDATCFGILSCPEQCAGIDVLHHVAIDALDILAGRLLPELDVLLMTAEHHVTAHEQQGVLGTQARLQLTLSVGSHGEQRLSALFQLLLRGVVPLFLPLLLGTIQITVQLLDVAHHQLVALPTGNLDGLVGIEPMVFAIIVS